jgi:hypothetical protein
MRRPAKAALTFALATLAALVLLSGAAFAATESDGSVVTFTRSTASYEAATERTWFIVTGRTTFDEDEAEEIEIPELPTSLPESSFGRLQLLQSAGLALDASTLEEAMNQLELPFMFAGREQWVRNLSSADGAASDPRLWNVSMESIFTDENSLRVLLGRAAWAVSERGTMADDVAYWQTLVPEWAPAARDTLAQKGYRFSVELLASPEIEVMDLSKPLFSKGAHPDSLFGLGVLQSGENAFLRSMGGDELMTEIWPMYFDYHHRPAGAPVPEYLEAGLTFGTVIAEECTNADPKVPENGCINGLRYKHTPVMSSAPYMRWLAYGMPGVEGDGQHNGYVVDGNTGYGYNPTTGEFFQVYDSDSYNAMFLELLQTGQLQPGYFITPWQDVVTDGLGSNIAAAGYLQDPSIWFQGQYAPYAPNLLSEDVRARYLTLVQGN